MNLNLNSNSIKEIHDNSHVFLPHHAAVGFEIHRKNISIQPSMHIQIMPKNEMLCSSQQPVVFYRTTHTMCNVSFYKRTLEIMN